MYDLPWQLRSAFSEQRLISMASFIADIRDEVIELHDEELGDTRLSLGMRAYECCRTRIIAASEEGLLPWLTILTPEKRFTFAIDGIPVRFTRNDPKHLPDKKLIVSESAAFQFALFESDPHSKLRWFFVFDTQYKSAADAVYFVGYSGIGEIVCQYEIPVERGVTLMADVSSSLSHAVELDEVVIGVKRPNLNTDASEDGS